MPEATFFVLDGDYLIPWCKDNYFLDKNKKYRANSCIVIINENTLHPSPFGRKRPVYRGLRG